MIRVECLNCRTAAYIEDGADPDAALACPPGSGCCEQDHHHGQAATSCPGGHGACPSPDNCPVHLGMQPHLDDSNGRDTSAGPCPGGHCGLGVDGCTVCRPLRIEIPAGSVRAQHAIGG